MGVSDISDQQSSPASDQMWSRKKQQRQQRGPRQNTDPNARCKRCPGFNEGHILLCIMLTLGLVTLSEGTETVHRLNYGILFRKENPVYIANDYWHHTFEIEYPVDISIPYISPCTTGNETCSMLSHIITQVNSIRSETATNLKSAIDTIEGLIPQSNIHKSHSRHSLPPLIGKLSSGLFGTATLDDVNILASHMKRISKMAIGLSKASSQHENHLSSFIRTVHSRMDNLKTGIETNVHAIQYVQSQLDSKVKNLEYSIEYMLGIMLDQIKKADKLNHKLAELKSGIVSLIQGKLSPMLIPTNALYNSLLDINSILKSKYPGFHLSISTVDDVYSDCGYLLARNGSKVYVTLKLPVSHSRKPFLLYKVLSYPVPINVTSDDATQLLDLPNYLIVSNTQHQYAALDVFDYSICSGEKTKYCSLNIAFNHATTKSCVISLFDNDIEGVKSLCNFRYVQDVITPKIMEIEPNSLLLYRTPLLFFKCLDDFRHMSGCDFCTVTIPCRCSLSTTDVYVTPRLASCHVHSDNITVLHLVNLALLQHFFDKSYVQNILADTKFLTALKVIIPKLKIYEHEMSNVLVDDSKANLSLAKMADEAKKDAVIFQSLTEPLLDNQIQLQTDWPDMNGMLLLGTMGVTVFLTIILFYTFLRVRELSAALLVVQQD